MTFSKKLMIFLMVWPAFQKAFGLTGDLTEKRQDFGLTEAKSLKAFVVSDLLKTGTMNLDSYNSLEYLLGEHAVSFDDILAAIDAEFFNFWKQHSPAVYFSLKDESKILGVRHKAYELKVNGIAVYQSHLNIHESDSQGLTMVRWSLPPVDSLSLEPVTFSRTLMERFFTKKDIVNLFPTLWQESAITIYVVHEERLKPAWKIQGIDAFGAFVSIFVDATKGEILFSETAGFGLITATNTPMVFDKNPKDGVLVPVDIPSLSKTGFLDAKFFSIFGPKDQTSLFMSLDTKKPAFENAQMLTDTRLRIKSGSFQYSAFRPQDREAFDQIQTYFFASRSTQWLWDRFGLDPDPALNFFSIYVGGSINGRFDNAMYMPLKEGPVIVIAQNDKLENLARDRDVITHELAHHVIYRSIKSSSGESGILHEGTADYLTYAQSLDPYLAESVVPGAPYLRSATIAPKGPIDELGSKVTNHAKGQLWSALLWRLAEESSHDRVVQLIKGMLQYVGARANLRDAFLGLVQADRDLSRLELKDSALGASQECRILEIGLALGFISALKDFSGEHCGLDMSEIAQLKNSHKNGKSPGETVKKSLKALTCGTIALSLPGKAPLLQLLGFLFIPLVLSLFIARFSHKRRSQHGS